MIDGKLLPLVISDENRGQLERLFRLCSLHRIRVPRACRTLSQRSCWSPQSAEVVAGRPAPQRINRPLRLRQQLAADHQSAPWAFLRADRGAYRVPAATLPDSAIVFRSINPLTDRPGLDALRTNGYELIPSRRVYILDTRDARYLEHRDIRADLGKLRKTCYLDR